MTAQTTGTKAPEAALPAPQDRKTLAYDARDLIRDGVSARIILDDVIYTLRITRAGKLILTK